MYNAKQSKTFAVTGDSIIPSKLFGWDMSETFGYKSCTIAIFLAIIIAILLYVVINKTTFGYELKACGCNKNAAKYAGIDEKRSIILSMIIAGALAGFGAGLYYLSNAAQWIPGDSTALPSEGFDGISVALLASSDPIAAIFSAIFISHISTGGGFMNASLFPPRLRTLSPALSSTSVRSRCCSRTLLSRSSRASTKSRRLSAGRGKAKRKGGAVRCF